MATRLLGGLTPELGVLWSLRPPPLPLLAFVIPCWEHRCLPTPEALHITGSLWPLPDPESECPGCTVISTPDTCLRGTDEEVLEII